MFVLMTWRWFEENLLRYDYRTSKRKASYLTKKIKNRKWWIALYASQKHLITCKEMLNNTQEIPCILFWQLPKSSMKSRFSISKKFAVKERLYYISSFISDSFMCFFFFLAFLHKHSRIIGLQRKGESIFLTLHYHFHLLHIHLDISFICHCSGNNSLVRYFLACSRSQRGEIVLFNWKKKQKLILWQEMLNA